MTADNHDPFAFARSEADADAELFALIEEYRHLDRRSDDLFEEADRRRKELALSPPSVEIGRIILPDGSFDPVYANAEKQITGERLVDRFGLALVRLVRAKHPKGSRVEMYDDRIDEQLAEFRAKLAANAARCKAAGVDALMDQCETIWGQTDAVLDKIDKTRPTTLRGVLAVFDFNTEKERDYWPEEAIAGLREIAKQEARP